MSPHIDDLCLVTYLVVAKVVKFVPSLNPLACMIPRLSVGTAQ